jgi:hypothetical protein
MKGAGGGKRGGRKPRSAEQDDRPRGYEAARMRQLWRDIDHAKRKAGLGPAPEPTPASPWDFTAMLELASTLANEVAAWMTTNAPAACSILTSGAELLRGVPVLGRLVDLVPAAAPPAPRPAGRKRPGEANGRSGGNGRPDRDVRVDPEDGEPNGKWIH